MAINLPMSYLSCAGFPTGVESGKLGRLSRERSLAHWIKKARAEATGIVEQEKENLDVQRRVLGSDSEMLETHRFWLDIYRKVRPISADVDNADDARERAELANVWPDPQAQWLSFLTFV